jgi:hypothetical protein
MEEQIMDAANTDADNAVLNMLERYEVLVMEDLVICQPGFSWTQLFLAADRLSRKNLIALRRIGSSYQIRRMNRGLSLSQNQHHEKPAASHRG